MSLVHGSGVVHLLGEDDISVYCNSTSKEFSADSHDVTTYQPGVPRPAHQFHGGLLNGKYTIGGFYDTAAGGPAAVIEPLVGQTVEHTYRPAGTGATKPQTVYQVVVLSFNESAPVADMITWTAELQPSGPPDVAPQGA